MKAGWYNGNSNSQTHPVGKLAVNAWNLHDIHGNVWEWCPDEYNDYTAENKSDPKGENSDNGPVLRGGSWDEAPEDCRASSRIWDALTARDELCGCRVCFRLD